MPPSNNRAVFLLRRPPKAPEVKKPNKHGKHKAKRVRDYKKEVIGISELIRQVCVHQMIHKDVAMHFFNDVITVIIEACRKDYLVNVPRLGKFEMVWSKERICKNPQKDYEPILVPKKRQLKLRVIRSLKNM